MLALVLWRGLHWFSSAVRLSKIEEVSTSCGQDDLCIVVVAVKRGVKPSATGGVDELHDNNNEAVTRRWKTRGEDRVALRDASFIAEHNDKDTKITGK